jgi:hypothetical protein
MQKIIDFIATNASTLIAGIVCIMLTLYVIGCQPTVISMADPNKRISRAELDAEVAYLQAQIEAKYQDLNKQEEVAKLITDQALLFSQGGQFNPTGLINLLVSIGGIGFGLDQRRKLVAANKTIAGQNNAAKTNTTT